MKNVALFVLSTLIGLLFVQPAYAQVYVRPFERGRAYILVYGGGGYYGGGGRAVATMMVAETVAVIGLEAYADRVARGPKLRDCSKKKPGDKKCEAALAEAQAEAELAERQQLGKKLYNSTRWPVQVLDCGQPVGQLRPRSNMQALEAKCGYVGVILTPDPTNPGRTQRYEAAFRLTDDAASGWVFRAPTNLGGAQ